MPCQLNSTNPTNISSGDCITPEEINNNIGKILENASSGDVVCVLTQGDLLEVKRLMAQKQK